ncbi:hypothetical protein CYMTET_26160, partial [Cymbomonas tetramitiformis]
ELSAICPLLDLASELSAICPLLDLASELSAICPLLDLDLALGPELSAMCPLLDLAPGSSLVAMRQIQTLEQRTELERLTSRLKQRMKRVFRVTEACFRGGDNQTLP